jgi:hypothetical protein
LASALGNFSLEDDGIRSIAVAGAPAGSGCRVDRIDRARKMQRISAGTPRRPASDESCVNSSSVRPAANCSTITPENPFDNLPT